MEKMVASIDELSETVSDLQDSIEPLGRFASRFPGRRKNAARNVED
jgi:tetrahydromethanopterin S-methyltransferase subunit B